MPSYRITVLLFVSFVATLLAAIHSPGQISVDSGVALYEGMSGQAVGWGPTFFAAVLSWLGGGVLGASVFVALNCLITYGVLGGAITIGVDARYVSKPRLAIAIALVANPLFMFYAGILWKDVMLASMAALVVVALLYSIGAERWRSFLALLLAMFCIAMLPLLRQQGILLAVPLAVVCAWEISARLASSIRRRLGVSILALSLTFAMSQIMASAAAIRVAALPTNPVSVGFLTIRAYDIAGMVAYAEPRDGSTWTEASPAAIKRMREGYSSERIDTLWHDPDVRGYVNKLSAEQSSEIWWKGISHDPEAYLTHRLRAFGALMGFGPMSGCVPAYWGVAAVPEHLAALGLNEEMDPRDRFIGSEVRRLEPTIVFRHWWYSALLLLSTFVLLRPKGRSSGQIWILRASVVAAWLYLGSFTATTIACDFRYLYPVSLIATVVCAYLLTHPRTSTA